MTHQGTIARRSDGYHVLPVPAALARPLVEAGVRRVVAHLEGRPFRRALLSDGEGGYHVHVGKPLLEALGARAGSRVRVSLEPDPDPDAVDVPAELEIALEQDDEARAIWDTWTPDRRRSIAHLVATAKREETRIRRAVELCAQMRRGTLALGGSSGRRAPR